MIGLMGTPLRAGDEVKVTFCCNEEGRTVVEA